MAAAMAPNGETVAFTLQGTVWTVPVAGGNATPLTDAMGDCHTPTWSPDGAWIAFQSFKSGAYQIWRVRVDGTNLEQLTYGVYDHREPHWSPTGDDIIFSSDRSGAYDVWSINLESRTLTRHSSEIAKASWPSYSPDGKQIIFLAEKQGLYLITLDEAETTLIFSGSDISAPAWTPDGGSLIFPRIGSATTKLQRLRLEDGVAEFLPSADVDIFPFRATWIGAEMVYTADGGIRRRMPDSEESNVIPFTAEVSLWRAPYEKRPFPFNETAAKEALGIRAPSLSPTGDVVVFSALGDLWLKPLGEPEQQLTNDHFVDLDPSWSPNGEQIVFASDRSGNMELWILNLEDGLSYQLTQSGLDLLYPAWSPDGSQIACFQVGRKNLWSNATLSLVDVSNGDIEIAHAPLFVPSRPSWSPDSRYLALATLKRYSSRFREGVSEIRIIDLGSGDKSLFSPMGHISMGPRGASGPSWSPEGDRIAFVQRGHLWQQRVASDGSPIGEPEPLTQSPGSCPTWGDKHRLLYIQNGRLYLLDNSDGSEVQLELSLTWVPEIPTATYAVHAGRMWDGIQDEYVSDVDIIIEGHRILAVEPHETRSFPVIDASAETVIPGLFDMHVHQHGVVGERLGRSWLAHGVTSVREVGADPYDALERKEAWASGSRPGPRLFFTGGMIDGARIYYGFANSVTSSQHQAWEMERAAALGYDLIKTYVRLPDADQKQITVSAHELGIPVTSHELYPAVSYGVDGIEHLGATSRRGFSLKQSALRIAYGDVKKLLAESGMYITPTLGGLGGMILHISLQPDVLTTPAYLSLVPENHRQSFENAYFRDSISQTRRLMVERQQSFITDLVAAGGKITAGTDVPFLPFGWSLHVELQLYVDGGLSPLNALRSATIWAAESTGADEDLGSLEAGKLADMVIVQGDPLKTIRDAWEVQRVIKGGVVYKIEDLLGP